MNLPKGQGNPKRGNELVEKKGGKPPKRHKTPRLSLQRAERQGRGTLRCPGMAVLCGWRNWPTSSVIFLVRLTPFSMVLPLEEQGHRVPGGDHATHWQTDFHRSHAAGRGDHGLSSDEQAAAGGDTAVGQRGAGECADV